MDRPDHRAFTALYSAHYGAVLGFVRRRLPDASAEDVVADASELRPPARQVRQGKLPVSRGNLRGTRGVE